MKTSNLILITAVVAMLIISTVFAANIPPNLTKGVSPRNVTPSGDPVGNNQDRLIKNINHVNEKLDIVIVKLENSKCEDATIDASVVAVEQLQNGLMDFIPKVEAADSMDALKTVRKELTDFLKQHNKDVQDANKALKVCAKEQTKATVQKMVANMAKMAAVAKVKCPSESEALQLQLQQMNQTSQQLQNELQSGNTDSAKQSGKKLMEQSQQAAAMAKNIYANCIPEEMKPKNTTK